MVASTTLEQFLDVSTRLDADEELLGELAGALPALAEKGAEHDVARLAAVQLGVALRLVLPGGGENPERFAPFVQASSAAAWWIAADSRQETILREELQDICGEEAASEITKLLSGAVEAITQVREHAGEQNPPAALPRAA